MDDATSQSSACFLTIIGLLSISKFLVINPKRLPRVAPVLSLANVFSGDPPLTGSLGRVNPVLMQCMKRSSAKKLFLLDETQEREEPETSDVEEANGTLTSTGKREETSRADRIQLCGLKKIGGDDAEDEVRWRLGVSLGTCAASSNVCRDAAAINVD